METTQDHTNSNNGDYALVSLQEEEDETLANSIKTWLKLFPVLYLARVLWYDPSDLTGKDVTLWTDLCPGTS